MVLPNTCTPTSRKAPTGRSNRFNSQAEVVVGSHGAIEDEIASRVRMAVYRLPEGQREVLTLVDIEGFSYGEVSTILGIPVGTVTSRISRARETLRSELAELVSDGSGHDNVFQLRSVNA